MVAARLGDRRANYSGEGSVAELLVDIIIWRTQVGHLGKHHCQCAVTTGKSRRQRHKMGNYSLKWGTFRAINVFLRTENDHVLIITRIQSPGCTITKVCNALKTDQNPQQRKRV